MATNPKTSPPKKLAKNLPEIKADEPVYRKVGRRYVEIGKYDDQAYRVLPPGAHLTVVAPALRTTRFCVEPALAPMIAAGIYGREAIVDAIDNAVKMRPTANMITEEQRLAWRKFEQIMGNDAYYIQWPSYNEIAEAGIKAMQDEAAKLMKYESVKKAYEDFLLVCKLTSDQ